MCNTLCNVAQPLHGCTEFKHGLQTGPHTVFSPSSIKTVFDFRLFLFVSARSLEGGRWAAAAFFGVAAGATGFKKCHIIIMNTNETPTRDRLMFEAGRIINILKTLEACPMFETSEKHPGKIRESAAGRMYRQYMSMLITVYKALDISGAPDSDISPLREYLASRGKGGENGNA